MANEGRSNTGLAFIVGGLVVAVAVLAYFVLGDGPSVTNEGSTTVNVETSDSGSDTGGDSGDSESGGGGAGSGDSGGGSDSGDSG